MRLQLRAACTKCRIKIHAAHRRIRSKDHLNVVTKIHREIDLTGIAMGRAMHIAKVGMSFGRAATGRTKQIPRHIKAASTRRTQEHFEDLPSVDMPAVCQRVWSNALNRQIVGALQKIFKMSKERSIRALMDDA